MLVSGVCLVGSDLRDRLLVSGAVTVQPVPNSHLLPHLNFRLHPSAFMLNLLPPSLPHFPLVSRNLWARYVFSVMFFNRLWLSYGVGYLYMILAGSLLLSQCLLGVAAAVKGKDALWRHCFLSSIPLVLSSACQPAVACRNTVSF